MIPTRKATVFKLNSPGSVSLQYSVNRVLLAATTLVIVLMFAFVPSQGLTPDETYAFFVLVIFHALYILALSRAQMSFGWTRLAPLVVTMNVILITITFAILYRALPSFWLLYIILPIIAALLFGSGWAYLSGALSALGYLGVTNVFGYIRGSLAQEMLNAAILLLFAIGADALGESVRRQFRSIQSKLTVTEAELHRTYLQVVMALANAVEARDSYTSDHAERLAKMTDTVGRELGLTPLQLEELNYAAILHDIGKIGIPDKVLNKPDKLDQTETEEMRRHPTIGAEILIPIPRLAGVARIILGHHERFDGKGYPDALAGEAIPLGARILCLVDSYSAMVDRRVYKEELQHEKALEELQRCAGSQFDPNVVDAFVRIGKRGLISTNNRLTG